MTIDSAMAFMRRPFTAEERNELDLLLPDDLIKELETDFDKGRVMLGDYVKWAGRNRKVRLVPMLLGLAGVYIFLIDPIFMGGVWNWQTAWGLGFCLSTLAMLKATGFAFQGMDSARAIAGAQAYEAIMARRSRDWFESALDHSYERQKDHVSDLLIAITRLKSFIDDLPDIPEFNRLKAFAQDNLVVKEAKPPSEEELRIVKDTKPFSSITEA